MKKYVPIIGICIILLAQCATGGSSTDGRIVSLDQAIRSASEHIQNTLKPGARVALLNFSSPTEGFSAYVLDELSELLVNGGKVMVVDRAELDLIRREERFQLSGEVSDATATRIGQKVGAQVIISGSLTGIGRTYRLRIRVLEVETAVVAASRSSDIDPREVRVRDLLAGKIPVVEIPPQTTPTPALAVVPSNQAPASTSTPTPQSATGNMVWVEGGTFMMGSDVGEDWDKPVHRVTVKGFYISKYQVTQAEWTAVMGNNPSNFKGDNLPVEQVSWLDAIEFCNRLSEKEGLTPCYRSSGSNITCDWNANGYRLPTEAEWEYAANGGSNVFLVTAYAGSNNADAVAWYYENSENKTHPVGTKTPNGLGLYDMSGNVWEWCWDWYVAYSSGVQTDPRGASSGINRVMRGGSWRHPAKFGRSAGRYNHPPSYRLSYNGFRIVRSR